MLTREEPHHNLVNLQELLSPSLVSQMCRRQFLGRKSLTNLVQTPVKETMASLSALEIAEQMTYMDQRIFFAIGSE